MTMMSLMKACRSFNLRDVRRTNSILLVLKWTIPAARAIFDNFRFLQFVRARLNITMSRSPTRLLLR